ncbi:MAG: MopE-related protein, partial [Flavobacteriales bacterium]
EAQALNFLYDHFYLATNSILHIYSADKSMVLGGFTSANNKSSELFASGNILGESVVIELFEPLSDYGQNRVSIEKIGYVYRNAFAEVNGEFRGGGSGSCEVNVACSEGDSWTDEEKGVVRILLTSNQGQGWCSGSLINNTSLNCAPYILTAWHCGLDSSPAQYNQYIYYFNYQTGSCGGSSASGTQSITGSTRIAYSNDGGGNSGSDFLLTEIDSDIPTSINAYYNGWNAVNTASSGGVGIHHPAGDYKKISTYTSNLVSTSWLNASNSHWRVIWSATENGHGVTEGGSSGSPIFNDDGLIIGQLTGGSSFCSSPNSPDLYGKMSYNWTSNGNQNFEQLKLFLDPTNSGLLTLDGTYAPCNDPTISGCTDPEALNYDSEAEIDDGSCNYPCLAAAVTLSFTLDCYGSETSWQLINNSNEIIYEVNENTYDGAEGNAQVGGSNDEVELCISAECYTLILNDSYGDGFFGSQWTNCGLDGDLVITDANGLILFDLSDPDFGESISIDFCLAEIDLDNDGFLVSEGDCNDGDDSIYPGATEVCDGVDNNCDGTIDENFIINQYWLDDDNDGFGNPEISTSSCFTPEGYVSNSNDCDDEDEDVNPNINEICDGKDNNCNGYIDEGFVTSVFFLDSDGDGYGNPNVSINSCFMPDGYADNDNDCNDANTNINPGMNEICNNADDDCSGVIDDNLTTQVYYEDDDNDSFGNPNVSVEDCSQPNGYVLNSLDCDDTNDDINPNGTEILDDAIDQDCDGSDLVTGVSENAISVFSIYPNPAKTIFYIDGLTEGQKIEIRDTTGRLVSSLTVKASNVFAIDVSSLARGAYLVKVLDNSLTTTQKIILN